MSQDFKTDFFAIADVYDTNYVLYRLPHAEHCVFLHQSVGEPLELDSYAALGDLSGFVFAPFKISNDAPVLLLQPDTVKRYNLSAVQTGSFDGALQCSANHEERTAYHSVFNFFHARLQAGDFDKIVLSRCSEELLPENESPSLLFLRACSLYPRMFIALVSMRKAGLWLMATPEILLESAGTEWRTMALAGTMRLATEQFNFDTPGCMMSQNAVSWSDKNVREQRYVASYIHERLSVHAYNIRESQPYTARAGHLIHLRSDFSFTLHDGNGIGSLIEDLYPTPAVCGIPRSSTYDFILRNEGLDRSYYSGFTGMLGMEGHTHLFVTLRCMRINGSQCSLYAGGGLLRDSVEETEWTETEAKMETMRRCFAIKKI